MQGPHPAKYAQRFEDHEKAAALEIYKIHGPERASVETGASAAAICHWAKEAGVTTQAPAARSKRVVAAQQKWAERRAIIAEKVGELADEALDAARGAIADGSSRDARDYASTMATAIDKAQLLTGGATERVGMEERFTEREDEIATARMRAQADASDARARADELARQQREALEVSSHEIPLFTDEGGRR